jgi:hypothetical protein
MEHRRFLTHSAAVRAVADRDLFARIGGRATIDALIDGLYDRIEADPVLRPMFGRHLSGERPARPTRPTFEPCGHTSNANLGDSASFVYDCLAFVAQFLILYTLLWEFFSPRHAFVGVAFVAGLSVLTLTFARPRATSADSRVWCRSTWRHS